MHFHSLRKLVLSHIAFISRIPCFFLLNIIYLDQSIALCDNATQAKRTVLRYCEIEDKNNYDVFGVLYPIGGKKHHCWSSISADGPLSPTKGDRGSMYERIPGFSRM